MSVRQNHLSDERIVELCLAEGHDLAGNEHLQACAACGARQTEVAALLEEISAAAVDEADAVFTPERLARQQARILQRIEQDGRPARVITFPGHVQDGPALRPKPAARWIAAAAAAGLVIGLLAGHLAHDIPGRAAAPSAVALRPATPEPGLRAVATTFSEDEFLGQIELAADSPGGFALRSLHDATPRAWEVK
jgi:hypothetical protein